MPGQDLSGRSGMFWVTVVNGEHFLYVAVIRAEGDGDSDISDDDGDGDDGGVADGGWWCCW